MDSKKVSLSLQPIPVKKSFDSLKEKSKTPIQLQDSNLNIKKWEKLEKQLHSIGYSSLILGDFTSGIQPLFNLKGPISCVEREPVFISFEWYNSLNIPLPLNCIYLQVESNHKINTNLLNSSSSSIIGPDFDLSVIPDVALDPHQRKLIQLSLVPKKVGQIKILGIAYLLSGIVPTHQPILRSLDEPFILDVRPPMPVLNVVLSLPEILYSGQYVFGKIKMTNTGSRDLYDLKMNCNHSNMIYIGSLDSHLDSHLNSNESVEPIEMNNSLNNQEIHSIDMSLYSLDKSNYLSHGSTLDIPILIRGQDIGTFNIQFVFGYVGLVCFYTFKYGIYLIMTFNRILISFEPLEYLKLYKLFQV